MIKIALQAGHQNIKDNCSENLRKGTGSPGEAIWTPKLREALSKILISKGFQVFLFDANANCQSESKQDFDLFLALHWDADVYAIGGGFADWPDPTVDAVSSRSKELAQKINASYFPRTNIEYHPERSNGNTKFYYMWQGLTAKTPCVLIECGTNNRDNLQNRTPEIAEALARAICQAFDVTFDIPALPTSTVTIRAILDQVKDVLYGSGWPWSKIDRLKQILPK